MKLINTLCAIMAATLLSAEAHAATGKPNILVLWGDDVGYYNASAYNQGMMGYKTPNIDSIAKEGALFTDMYAQQSCTAGRASFILGQQPFRTGLLTIGMPGSDHGIPDWTPTIADLLTEQGYATGQFGKNHLGDQDKHLPTNHGFDEFFGNLYHLNAEDSMNSSATSTTSTRRKSRKPITTRKIPSSIKSSVLAVSFTLSLMARSKIPVH
jgi:arylsulfatase